MQIDHLKIIEALGGPGAVSKRLSIKVPSVYGWMGEAKAIPDGRLIELGADIEATGLYTRKQIRPNDWQVIWPELVEVVVTTSIDVSADRIGEVVVAAGDALGYDAINNELKAD